MSAPVDVLAVMAGTIEGYEASLPRLRGKQRDECEDGLADLKDARAAVAELIETSSYLKRDASDEQWGAFHAALARVRGAA